MKTITVLDYPQTFSFKVKKELPTFEYGCEERRRILIRQMKRQDIFSPCHLYTDYVVEEVISNGTQEYWRLGS